MSFVCLFRCGANIKCAQRLYSRRRETFATSFVCLFRWGANIKYSQRLYSRNRETFVTSFVRLFARTRGQKFAGIIFALQRSARDVGRLPWGANIKRSQRLHSRRNETLVMSFVCSFRWGAQVICFLEVIFRSCSALTKHHDHLELSAQSSKLSRSPVGK